METLIFIILSIVCIFLIVVLVPYIIAIPLGIIKAIWLIVSGHENDPEIVELKEAKKREMAAKKEARKEKRKYVWRIPTSLFGFFR